MIYDDEMKDFRLALDKLRVLFVLLHDAKEEVGEVIYRMEAWQTASQKAELQDVQTPQLKLDRKVHRAIGRGGE